MQRYLRMENHAATGLYEKEQLLSDALTIHNTNAEVAAALGITEKTVVNYLTILYDKAGVKNKLEFLEKMGRLN